MDFIDERRAGNDRRNPERQNSAAPFETAQGRIYQDRRKSPDRRRIDLAALVQSGDVEEIVLEPLRFQ